MKYEVEIDGHKMSLDLGGQQDECDVKVDGRTYNARVARPQPGAYLMFVGERVYEARVVAAETGRLAVKLGGRLFHARVIDPKHRPPATEQSAEGRQQLSAPMPGKVVRVILSPGDEVAAGQGVLVVEAMKMQSEIKSPKAGRVLEVRVAEGDTVNAGQVLAIVE